MHCLIITKNRINANAFKRQLLVSAEVPPPKIDIFIAQAPTSKDWRVTDEFNRISDWIETTVCGTDNITALRDTVVITDLAPFHFGEGSALNPCKQVITDEESWAPVLAMLILSFPEIQWVAPADQCGDPLPDTLREDDLYRKAHTLGLTGSAKEAFKLKREGFEPLFDPSGLRDRIRKQIVSGKDHKDVPLRTQQSAAIDEEHSYAYLHAYTAYRFGFSSHVVTSEEMMKQLFSNDKIADLGSRFLLFEDLFLKFAESGPDTHYSKLSERDDEKKFPYLAQAKYRIVITSGHRRKDDRNKLRENYQYLKRFKPSQHNHVLYKPLAGVFDLWADSKLDRKLIKGLADDFVWPPHHDDKSLSIGNHSAPGRLLVIATRLIDRADRLLSEVRCVADCVHGAVLATDALEILAERTPTSSLEALMLKHRFEVLAESQFCGVQDSLEVKSRLEDIRHEVESLSYWFDPKREDFIKWNAEAAIINRLILIYRDFNSFDEEQKALARSRTLHRKMWFNKHWYYKPFEILAWYVEKLLNSVPLFIIALFCWVFALGWLYDHTSIKVTVEGSKYTGSAWLGFYQAIGSFFAVQPPQGAIEATINPYVAELAIVSGFVHLGIFVSHLYSIVTRK